MKKIFLFLSIIVLIIALAGCGLLFRREPDPDPTPTLVPTTAPIEEAVEEPTEEPMEEPAAEGIDEPEDTEEPGEAEAMMISEVDIAASPYTALANETFATVAAATAECPVREFPIPDPDTNTKRGLDFTPFAEAMAGFTPEMAASLDASLINATLPEIQALMADGTITSEQLVLYYLDRIQRYDANKLNSILELNPAALADAQALAQA